MKKIIVVILAVMLAFQMVACSKSNDSTGGSSSDNGNTPANNIADIVDISSTYGATKVLQNRDIEYPDLGKQLSVSMMKNESEGTQLVLKAKKDVASYELKAADLKCGDAVLSKDSIKIYQENYVKILKRADLNNQNINPAFKVGDYIPDMLLDMDKAVEYKENTIASGENRSVYVEFKTSMETKAGVYTGNFTLEVDGFTTEIPVSVTVWDFGFDRKSDFESVFLLYRWGLTHGEYDCTDEKVFDYIDAALDYEVNIYPIGTFDYSKDEEIDNDAAKKEGYASAVVKGFVEYVDKYYAENRAFNTITIPISLTVSYKHSESSSASNNILNYLEKLLEHSYANGYGPEYLERTVLYMSGVDEADNRPSDWKRCYDLFDEGGEADKLLDYLWKNIEQNEIYKNATDEDKVRIEIAVKNLPFLLTCVYFDDDAVGRFTSSVFCPLIDKFANPINVMKYKEAAERYNNSNLWVYTCTGCPYPSPSFHIDDYNYGNRVAGWMYKYYDLNGFLYWQTAQYYPSASGYDGYLDVYEDPTRSYVFNGEGCLFYPGAKYGSEKPFPSTRIVNYRDSIEDYNMICLLEDLINEYGIDRDVNDYLADVYISIFNNAVYYNEDDLVYLAREELASRINYLIKNHELKETAKIETTINSFSDGNYDADKADSKFSVTQNSSVAYSDNSAEVTIRHVERKNESQNMLYKTNVKFAISGLSDFANATNLNFTIENICDDAEADNNLEFEIYLVTADEDIYVGGCYLGTGKTKDVKVYFDKDVSKYLGKATHIKFSFSNMKNGKFSPDFKFRLSNFSFERNGG